MSAAVAPRIAPSPLAVRHGHGSPPPSRHAIVVGRATLTNIGLAAAFDAQGFRTTIRAPARRLDLDPAAVVLTRLDVLPSLDGVEEGLWSLDAFGRNGRFLLNPPLAVLNAHDKLATALVLARHGVDHPRTAHVRDATVPSSFGPPYVVKPRFGSWGRDVFRCETDRDLLKRLDQLRHRRWFRRQGALVQELVAPGGRDLRLVVAGGHVIGAVERVARPGEWRTNVSLGGVRRAIDPPAAAQKVARQAAAALGIDLAGIDLIARPDRGFDVLEVNGAVDFTPEYGKRPFLAAVAALALRAEQTIAVAR